jgi:hypothetical protein
MAAWQAYSRNFKLGNYFCICLKQRKTKKTCVEMAGRRTFRMHTDGEPAVRQVKKYSNPLGFPRTSAVGFIENFSTTAWLSNYNFSINENNNSFSTYHHNVFTFTAPLSEGRAGITWVPSNKMFFLLPVRNRLSLLPKMFCSLFLLFYSPSRISLSLRLQRLN